LVSVAAKEMLELGFPKDQTRPRLKRLSRRRVVKGLGFALARQPKVILVLEFMQKGSIEGCLGELSSDEKVAAIVSLVQAAKFIHDQKLIHGDLKPSNLLIDAEGHAKVGDFGALRAADGSTQTAIPMTMAYVAAGAVKSDLFSLGMTIVFIVTWRHALDLTGKSVLAAVQAVTRGPQVELPASVKPGLAELVKNLCAVDPAQRPASAQEVF
jgi:serine/threonine protein kinase